MCSPCKWGSIEFPLPFGRVMSPSESAIHGMDEKVWLLCTRCLENNFGIRCFIIIVFWLLCSQFLCPCTWIHDRILWNCRVQVAYQCSFCINAFQISLFHIGCVVFMFYCLRFFCLLFHVLNVLSGHHSNKYQSKIVVNNISLSLLRAFNTDSENNSMLSIINLKILNKKREAFQVFARVLFI